MFLGFYTPNGYIVPAKFGFYFLPLAKNVPKRTQLHLNEISLTNTEFCESQLRQPPLLENSLFFDFLQQGSKINRNSYVMLTMQICLYYIKRIRYDNFSCNEENECQISLALYIRSEFSTYYLHCV